MSPEQLLVLKAAIAADPILSAYPPGSDGAWAIALLLNQPSSPDVVVWRTSMAVDEVMRNGMDWTRVDNLSVGKARIWDWMTNLGTFNPAKANVRAGIDATWVGTAADLAVRASVYTHCKRSATRGEAMFAVGSGTDASPSTMAVEGNFNWQMVEEARTA